MRNSTSLTEYIGQEKPEMRCDDCIIKQMIELGDCCYWPDGKGRWEHFLPEVEVTTCDYVNALILGQRIDEKRAEEFEDCLLFLPKIDWAGLRKQDLKIMQSLSDFIFLSIGIRSDVDTLSKVFQKVRRISGVRIVSTGEGEDILKYEEKNYRLFGLVRDAIAELMTGEEDTDE